MQRHHVISLLLTLTLVHLVHSAAILNPDIDQGPTPASLADRAAATTASAGCWSGTAFPAPSTWAGYNYNFNVQAGEMKYGNDTPAEITAINNSINALSTSSGIDKRFILAIMMRESSGVTTVSCGDNGKSCGLMQVQGSGVPSCSKHPCPAATIRQMIKCGVTGCSGGSIADCKSRYSTYGTPGQGGWGAIARCYNTGTVPNASDFTQATYGIRTYVQDIANILTGQSILGWVPYDNGQCGYTN